MAKRQSVSERVATCELAEGIEREKYLEVMEIVARLEPEAFDLLHERLSRARTVLNGANMG